MAKKIQSSDIFEGDLLKVLIDEIVKAEAKLEGFSKKLEGVGSKLQDELKGLKIGDLDSINKLLQKSKEIENSMKEQLKLEKEQQNLESKRLALQEKLDAVKKKNQQDEIARLEKIKGIQAKNYEEAYRDLLKNEAEIKRLDELKKKASSDELIRIEKERQAIEKTATEQRINISKIQEAQTKADLLSQKLSANTNKEADRQRNEARKEADRLQRDAEKEQKRLSNEAKNAKDLANAYKQLEKNTRDLKNESKKLGAELLELERNGEKNTKAYRNLKRQYDEVTKSAIEGDRALKKLDGSVGDNFRSVGNYEKALGGLKNAFMQLGIAFGAVDIAKYFIGTQVKLDSLKLSLQNVTDSTKEYQASFAFLKGISLSYGQDLLSLVSTYKNFIASTNESNLTLAERKRIYESIVKAGSALALSNDDVQGTLRAVQQMFSKGTVQAEELRQQLGDRLPGAFGLMAKAVGVSEAELGKMMKNGEVLTDEVMPRFAVLLEEQFGKKASKNLQTLNGSFNVLRTNLTLYFDRAQSNVGLNRLLSSAILLLAKNIKFLINNLVDLGVAFTSYKLLALSATVVTKGLEQGFVGLFKGAYKSAEGVKLLGLSFKSIGFVAIIDGVIKLTNYFIDLSKGTDLARLAYEKYQNAQKNGNQNANKFLLDINDSYNKKINLLLEKRKKNLISADELDKKTKEAEGERIDAIKKKIQVLSNAQDKYERARRYIRQLNDGKAPTAADAKVDFKVDWTDAIFGGADDASTEVGLSRDAELRTLFERYSNYGAKLYRVNTELVSYNNELQKQEILNKKVSRATQKTANDVAEHTKKVVEMNTEFKETNVYLSRQEELLKDIDYLLAKDKEFKYHSNLDEIIENERKLIEKERKYNRKNVAEAYSKDMQNQMLTETNKYLSKANDRRIKTKKLYDDEKKEVLDQETDKLNKLKKLEDDYIIKKMDNNKNLRKKLSKASAQDAQKMKEKLISDNTELAKFRKQIEDNKAKEMKVVEDNNAKRQADLQLEEKADLQNFTNQMNQIEVNSIKEKNKTIKQLDEEEAQAKLDNIKKMANMTNQIVETALDAYIRNIQDKINLLDDRMNRIAQTSQYLQDKANAGNIVASESLAKAQKDQLDAEKQKINYQRSIQRLQMALAIFNAYNNNIQNAKVGENAFTKTITDVSQLSAFIQSIPQFYKGTETTVGEALGKPQLSGRDGHIVRVDGSEKILNPYLSQKTGDLTTFEIAKIAEDRLKGKLVYNVENNTGNNIWASIKLIDEIQDLKTIIKSKPETNIAMGEIVGGVMKIVETTKVNNTITRNIHRFNKKI